MPLWPAYRQLYFYPFLVVVIGKAYTQYFGKMQDTLMLNYYIYIYVFTDAS